MTGQRMKICITQILSNCIEDKYGKDNNDPMVTKIKADLEKTKKVFTQIKELEDAVMETFQSLENHISEEETDVVSEKLNAITKTGEEIKRIKTENFPEIEEKPFVRQQQSFPNDENKKKMPENSSSSQIEQNLSLLQIQQDYNSLPENKKSCLLTLAVFHENAVIKKRILIHWWIGEGFATEFGDMIAEKVGEKIFDELIDKGWIQPCRKTKKSPTIYGCTMSPGIRRMLISNAQQSNFFDFDMTGNLTLDYVESGRLILDKGRSSSIDSHPQSRLLTIFNLNEKYLSPKEDFFSKNKELKVLQLGRWQISPRHHIEVENCKFLYRLKIQKQLKYLSLRGISQIITLPDSMSECINLEILDLKACHSLERLFNIRNLYKLKHFNISGCYCLQDSEKITSQIWYRSLHVIKGITPNHLRLPIILGTHRLRVMTLTWRHDSSESSFEYAHTDFNVLPFLEKIKLTLYPLPQLPYFTFPSKSPNLKKLYIKGGSLEDFTLPSYSTNSDSFKVEILRLNYLKKFRLEESYDMQKQFPKLKYLEKLNCHSSSTKKTHDKADIEWRIEDGWQTLNDKLKQDAH